MDRDRSEASQDEVLGKPGVIGSGIMDDSYPRQMSEKLKLFAHYITATTEVQDRGKIYLMALAIVEGK